MEDSITRSRTLRSRQVERSEDCEIVEDRSKRFDRNERMDCRAAERVKLAPAGGKRGKEWRGGGGEV